MDLFVERGYDQTTVAEIAERAGLTERTFFRHFSDKREVLFQGGEILQEAMVQALAAAPAAATPLGAIRAALDAVAQFFDGRHDRAQFRQGIIDAHPELQEREVAKMAKIALALAAGPARARRRRPGRPAGGGRGRRRVPVGVRPVGVRRFRRHDRGRWRSASPRWRSWSSKAAEPGLTSP